jgi:hypothetical protein
MRQKPTVASFKRLGLAIKDPRLNRAHLRVLERLMDRLNTSTGTAWPGRAAIAEAAGLNPDRAQNCLYDLRKCGLLAVGAARAPGVAQAAAPPLHAAPVEPVGR